MSHSQDKYAKIVRELIALHLWEPDRTAVLEWFNMVAARHSHGFNRARREGKVAERLQWPGAAENKPEGRTGGADKGIG